jgi:hypothetical protein
MSDFSEMIKAQLDAIQSATRTAYQAGFDVGFKAGIEEAQKIVAKNCPAGAGGANEKQPTSKTS